MKHIDTLARNRFKQLVTHAVTVALVALNGCGGGSTAGTETANASTFTVSGTVRGLSGAKVVLQNNAGDDLTVVKNGQFTFATSLTPGSTYSVSVKTQPVSTDHQTCSVDNGNGTISSRAIADVDITCWSSYPPIFAYVITAGDSGSGGISSFTVNPDTGSLTSTGAIASGSQDNYYSIAGSPPYSFVYVTNYGLNTISAYSVNNATGTLTQIGPAVPTGNQPFYNTVDPLGRFVYTINNGDPSISTFQIDNNVGTLSSSGTIQTPNEFLGSIILDPSGRFLYGVDNGNNTIRVYSIDQTTGIPTQSAAQASNLVVTGNGPFFMAIDPAGKYAYVANYYDNTISVLSIDSSTGILAATGNMPIATDIGPYEILMHPSGRFVFIGNYITGTVSSYKVNNTNGSLTLAGVPAIIPNDGGSQPGHSQRIFVDPSGQFLYNVDDHINIISIYSIDAVSGALSLVGTQRVMGASGNSILITR